MVEVSASPAGESKVRGGGKPSVNHWPWLLIASLVAIWFPAINHLRYEWELNEQYRYGFVVPLLVLYLFSLRWADRPTPAVGRGGVFSAAFASILLASTTPLLLAEGANPDWRLLSWTLTGITALLTLTALGHVGGKRWAWHFAFPVLFILVAVPWPMRLESTLIQLLMRANAAVAVDMVNLFGMPAQQAGNLIDLGASTVGVDEACSGVRSLQTTLMAGLFLGELYRFPIVRRIGLLVVTLGVALFWNLVRTLILVAIAANWDTTLMTTWHDRIGLTILVCSLGSVFGLAQMARWLEMPRAQTSVKAGSGKLFSSGTGVLASIPRSWCWTSIVWVVATIGAVELWYHSGQTAERQNFSWTVQWPAELAAQREVPIPHQTWRLMKFTSGVNRTWKDEQGRHWSGYYLEWAPGRTAQSLAQVHRPDICLPASGKTLIADRGTQTFTVNGITFPFRHYIFDDGGTPLQVYFSLQQPGSKEKAGDAVLAPYQGLELANRIAAVRERRRNLGQQQLELGVWGITDEQEAAVALVGMLEKLVARR